MEVAGQILLQNILETFNLISRKTWHHFDAVQSLKCQYELNISSCIKYTKDRSQNSLSSNCTYLCIYEMHIHESYVNIYLVISSSMWRATGELQMVTFVRINYENDTVNQFEIVLRKRSLSAWTFHQSGALRTGEKKVLEYACLCGRNLRRKWKLSCN